ncbi:MAG: hypothetical protein U0326_11430 [Polyangiales bacterium]
MRPWHPALVSFGLLALAVTPWPGDWDAVGFASAVTRFDLSAFSPHPPGYPVYVLLSRALNVVARSPVIACGLASALGAALAVLALARSIPSRPWAALLALASPALALAGTSARSDAPGLGLAALACASRDPFAAGALLSLALGARPAYAVLVASIAVALAASFDRRGRLAMLSTFTVVTAGWAAWLALASGGVARYVALTRAHVEGHFGEWGGSALTRPDTAERLRDTARSITAGLGLDATPHGAIRALAWLTLAALGLRALTPRLRWTLAAVIAPYALVAYFTQNVSAGSRHMLPVTLAIAALAANGAASLASAVRASTLRAGLLAALGALLAWPSFIAVTTQRRVMPPGVAIAREVLAQHPRRDALVFGGRSARLTGWAGQPAKTVVYMGEVDVTLGRLDRLPGAVYVTDEVTATGRPAGTFGASFTRCRASVIDRAATCVTVRRYDVLGR